MLRFARANRIVTLGCSVWLLIVAGFAAWTLGLEFLPHLEENNLWIRATLPQSISLEEGAAYVNRMRKVIGGFPQVETVVSQHGRPQDGTDATGFFNVEFFAAQTVQPMADAHIERRPHRPDRRRTGKPVSRRVVQFLPVH